MGNKREGVYEVGYGKPPQTKRFRKGKSGNPSGRAKGPRDVTKLLLQALSEPVTVNENGQRRQITKGQAMLKQLVNKGAAGDARSIQLLLTELRSRMDADPAEDTGPEDTHEQMLMLERLTVDERIELRRLIAKAEGPPNAGGGENMPVDDSVIAQRAADRGPRILRRLPKEPQVEHLLTVVKSTMKMPNKHLKLKVELLDRSLAQDSLAEFVKQAWHVVEPKTAIQWNWHLDAICEHLEAVTADDGINRLIINLPPRSGKSILASVMWPAWVWARQPSTRWLCASYSAILANKLSADRRSVITSPWYQQRWPLQLASDQNQKGEFVNTARGHMIATSVSGSATGRGGDCIVADDLQNPEMAESTAERETVNRFFDETLTTRLDDKRRGRIVVIQQRTHQADLTGHLLEQGGWTQLCLPAEFERRTVISMPRSRRDVVRVEGDLLWAQREGRAELDAAKIRLGSYGYACQYQQNPIARGGNLFKEKWFGTFREIPKFDALIQSWDCAFKAERTNDYSACVTVGWVNPNRARLTAPPGFYLVDAWRGRVEFPELKRQAQWLYEQRHPSVVLIEDTASGQSLLQELRTALPIQGVKPDADKIARAHSITPTIENGQLWLLEGAPWFKDYIDEMTGFPGAAHDDFVDATVQALTHLRVAEPAIIKYYRDMAGAEKAREQVREFPRISNYEVARYRLEAGNCDRCGVSLFMKSSVTGVPGPLCRDCFKQQQSYCQAPVAA